MAWEWTKIPSTSSIFQTLFLAFIFLILPFPIQKPSTIFFSSLIHRLHFFFFSKINSKTTTNLHLQYQILFHHKSSWNSENHYQIQTNEPRNMMWPKNQTNPETKMIENSSVVAVAGDGRRHHTMSQTQNQQPSSCTPENETNRNKNITQIEEIEQESIAENNNNQQLTV